MKKNKHIQKAVQYFGTQSKLANALKVTQGQVNKWLYNKRRVMPYTAVDINRVTNGYVKASLFYDFLTDTPFTEEPTNTTPKPKTKEMNI
jgi:transcriptional regulator with XRE-family HTH domain